MFATTPCQHPTHPPTLAAGEMLEHLLAPANATSGRETRETTVIDFFLRCLPQPAALEEISPPSDLPKSSPLPAGWSAGAEAGWHLATGAGNTERTPTTTAPQGLGWDVPRGRNRGFDGSGGSRWRMSGVLGARLGMHFVQTLSGSSWGLSGGSLSTSLLCRGPLEKQM